MINETEKNIPTTEQKNPAKKFFFARKASQKQVESVIKVL